MFCFIPTKVFLCFQSCLLFYVNFEKIHSRLVLLFPIFRYSRLQESQCSQSNFFLWPYDLLGGLQSLPLFFWPAVIGGDYLSTILGTLQGGLKTINISFYCLLELSLSVPCYIKFAPLIYFQYPLEEGRMLL